MEKILNYTINRLIEEDKNISKSFVAIRTKHDKMQKKILFLLHAQSHQLGRVISLFIGQVQIQAPQHPVVNLLIADRTFPQTGPTMRHPRFVPRVSPQTKP